MHTFLFRWRFLFPLAVYRGVSDLSRAAYKVPGVVMRGQRVSTLPLEAWLLTRVHFYFLCIFFNLLTCAQQPQSCVFVLACVSVTPSCFMLLPQAFLIPPVSILLSVGYFSPLETWILILVGILLVIEITEGISQFPSCYRLGAGGLREGRGGMREELKSLEAGAGHHSACALGCSPGLRPARPGSLHSTCRSALA